jgi:hypothetical protein
MAKGMSTTASACVVRRVYALSTTRCALPRSSGCADTAARRGVAATASERARRRAGAAAASSLRMALAAQCPLTCVQSHKASIAANSIAVQRSQNGVLQR